MKLHDWNQPLARWDRYKAFHMSIRPYGAVDISNHYGNAPFVQFDTGELICNLTSPGPEDRGDYSCLNVSVYGTTDKQCPSLYMPGETRPVPLAWLDCGGMQYLLIDHDLKRAYRLDDCLDVSRIPQRFVTDPEQRRWQAIRAYYPGPGREPIAGQVTVRPPFKPTADEREHVETLVATARATITLTDHTAKYLTTTVALAPERLLAVKDWQELSDKELGQLYHSGLDRRTIRLPYLLTEQPGG